MASLVSAGTSVTIIDQSFFIPGAAATVPLMFVATQSNKNQPDGLTLAAGTAESDVVRAISSLGQSIQMYGVPSFRADMSGNQFHGDARNEYGLFGLNQFLGIGSLAYVVRANIDLADATSTFIACGTPVAGTVTRVGVGNGTLGSITASSVFVKPETIDVVMNSATTFTVSGSLSGVIGTGTVGVAFTSTKINFTITAGLTPFSADDYFEFSLGYVPSTHTGTGNGTMTLLTPKTAAVAETWTVTFTSATAFTVSGSVSGPSATGTVGVAYSNSFISFTIVAGSTPFTTSDAFTMVLTVVELFNPLGANDAAKRLAIVTALNAVINSNTEVRSEIYEYNLIVCPGYPEVVTNLVALSNDINDEAFVIADAPSTNTPEQTAVWAMSSGRTSSSNVAYYYPWGLASNLDGTSVFVAPSGIALRTYAYSDNQAYVWFAPAGVSRGSVTGVGKLGYVSGTLGTATTFVETNLNQGQRDILYQYFANINPIVFFPGHGMIVWGQKTSYAAASELDRVSVMRTLMFIKRELRKGSFPFIFEPNDQITRNNLKAAADGFLNDIMAHRGLTDFATQSDLGNNSPSQISNNEMHMNVAVIPMNAAEFIYIPITVYAQGASLPK